MLFFIPLSLILGMMWGFGLLRAINPSPLFIEAPERSVPDFTVYSHQGDTLSPADLKDKVWIAHFLRPECGEPCLSRIRQVRDVQYSVSKFKHFRLLSFSLDPIADRNAMWAFGRKYSNYPGWHFVYQDTARMMQVMGQLGFSGRNFALGSPEEVAVIDGEGRVRGYYNPMDSAGYSNLVNDIVLLLRHDDE